MYFGALSLSRKVKENISVVIIGKNEVKPLKAFEAADMFVKKRWIIEMFTRIQVVVIWIVLEWLVMEQQINVDGTVSRFYVETMRSQNVLQS